MTRGLPLLVLVALLAAGCGGNERSTQTSTPTTVGVTTGTQGTPTGPPLTVVVYFYRGDRLAPVPVEVARTRGVANAALQALLDGPPNGYTTAIPDGTRGRVVGIAKDGSAALELPNLSDRADAQLVYTLTRIPRIVGVGYPGIQNPETGEASDAAMTRAKYERYVPPILIESPLPNDQVSAPVRVRGTASVYEATLVLELVQNDKVVTKQTISASEGAPARGVFLTALSGGKAGPATVVAFAPNAAGGPPQHRVEVPVEITP
ncbi:MAG TPA: Gmad2 immunoglobulin-like domain-containing protein [Gaiellaceae bacterium]|jgi:hypothetical protein